MQLLFYRQDLLEQAGVEPSTSWDEVVAAIKTIQDSGDAAGIAFVLVDFSVIITVVLAMSLALFLRRKGRMHTFTRIVLILPFAMSPALIGVSYRFMFNPEFVVLAKGLAGVFPSLAGTPWLTSRDLAMGILIVTDVWHWTPYKTFMCLVGLASVPRETEEAARIDGASNLRVIFEIVLPQMKGVLAVTAVLKTIFFSKDV